MAFTPQNFQNQNLPVVSAGWLNAADVTLNFVLGGAQTVPAAVAALGIVNQNPYPVLIAEGATVVNPFVAYGNVLRYGNNAVPGTTDMTAAFQASVAAGNAVTYAPASGGPYAVGSSSTALGAGQSIVGDGPGATSILANSATNDIFVLNGSYSSISNLGISNVAGVTRTAGRYVYGVGFGARVFNLQIQNHWTAFEFNGVSQTIDLINIRQGASISSKSILISGGNDQYISRIVSDGGASILSAAGLEVTATGGVWCRDSDFIHSVNGVLLNPGSGQTVEFGFFDNVCGDTCSNAGWALNPINGGTLVSIYTVNCWGSTATINGLQHFVTGAGCTLNGIHHTNFRALNNGEDGISVSGGTTPTPSDITFVNCRAAGNSASTVGGAGPTYAGLHIGANVSGVTVIGGKYGPGETEGDTQLNQIQVDAGTGDFIIINDADVRTAQNPISFNATPGTNSCSIKDCPGWRTRNRVEGEITSGTSTVSIPHGLPFTPVQAGCQVTALSNLTAAGIASIWVASTNSTDVVVDSNANATANTFILVDINGYPSFL